MKRRMLVPLMICMLAFSTMALALSPAMAAPTTSVTVTKLANDGVTVLDQVTVTVQEMMANSPELPVYGDGVTHYYAQGPTFDSDPWDADESTTASINSRDFGASKGNDVKDLCELLPAGGASPGDEIKVKASDGYYKTFDYANVYTTQPAQGKMIITWETADTAEGTSGSVTDGTYSNGMRLVFFAETVNAEGKHVFGNWDMHETFAEEDWHFYEKPDKPSSSGLSVKFVSEIIIYSSGAPESWSLQLSGVDSYTMPQGEFEHGAICHQASWVDGANTWSGIPLWLLLGYVDDGKRHGEGAFNDNVAAAGYTIKVIASDGYNKTFASADVARNDTIIVANKLNGEDLPEEQYPLRLVGPNLTGGQKVSKIAEIQLISLPKGEASASLNATANVAIDMVGIELDRSSVDYGDVSPGENSSVQTVGVTNIGTLNCNVTLEVKGANGIAQNFYDQSLHVGGNLYNINAVIASIPVQGSQNINTQLKVPSSWNEAGAQDATFIFWASASG